MRFQTCFLSLFLLALILAPYVDASAKKKNKKKKKNKNKNKNKKVPILSDDSTGRSDAVALPSPLVLKPKPNSKPASLLVDTTNAAPAVQLKDQGILVQGVPEVNRVSEYDEQTKKFAKLIKKRQYKEIAKLGKDMSDKELLKCLCQVVSSLDHFKGLYEYLKQRKLVPSFLAHGEVTLVQRAMAEGDDNGMLQIKQDFILDAIDLCFTEDRYERAIDLMGAEQEIHENEEDFEEFIYDLFHKFIPESSRASLKRFLTLHGKQFSEEDPDIFEVFCEKLAFASKHWYSDSSTKRPLVDYIGQPSMLTPTALATEFLGGDEDQIEFIQYGWKEAIAEGVKGGHEFGGKYLWRTMVKEYPDRFSGEFPSSENALAAVIEKFPTKQELEEAWAETNAPILLKHLEMLVTELQLPLPRDRLLIVAGYAITWINV